jgi:hypothetical protein
MGIADLSECSRQAGRVLIIAHCNPQKSLGGVEKVMREQLAALRECSVGSIIVYPLRGTVSRFAVLVDEVHFADLSLRELAAFIQRSQAEIRCLYVHHLLYWELPDFFDVASLFQGTGVPRYCFAHDFFVCCLGANLPCLDLQQKTVCGLPGESEHRPPCCNDGNFPGGVSRWRVAMRRLFAWADALVVPSLFVADVLGRVYPHFRSKIIVREYLRMIRGGVRPETVPAKDRRWRLGYLGVKSWHKGWDTWQALYADPSLRRRHEFLHIGCEEQYSPHVLSVPYSSERDGAMAAVAALASARVDMVLLWSVLHESYSYTFHEARAAGLPVLTNRRSGNIAWSIQTLAEPVGLILEDVQALRAFLKDAARVAALLEPDRFTYRLEPEPFLGDWLAPAARSQPAAVPS